jgi:hypothetical protein
MKGTTHCYTLEKPFVMFAKVRTCNEWRELIDSMRTKGTLRGIALVTFEHKLMNLTSYFMKT